MKKFLASVLLTTALATQAQVSGVYQLFTGADIIPAHTTNVYVFFGQTNYIGLPGTSSNLFMSVADYNDAGFTWSYLGTNSTTNGAVNLKVWEKDDASVNIWNSSPTWTFSTTPAGTGTYLTNCDLSVPGANTLAFTVENGTDGPLNSALLEINLKLAKFGTVQKTQ